MNTCPHCLGATCIHCRTPRAKVARGRERSRLKPAERRALGLIPLHGLIIDGKAPPPPKPRTIGLTVLPKGFDLERALASADYRLERR